jgi:arylsulfatase A-like enzyme
MRILYIDIDTLRADHLGCYGYPRATSPNIDAFAKRAVRFENVHASDTPCLPSRTALLTGRFGIHNGVVNHGGTDADPVIDGPRRGFWSSLHQTSFPNRLARAGLRPVTISSFAARHSAFHWHAGFREAYDVGGYGMEIADDVARIAHDWLDRRGAEDNWFLHVHLWDPHTPYRTPAAYGDPFADAPLPAWLSEQIRAADWAGCGPHSAQECMGFAPRPRLAELFPRQPQQIPDMAAVRRLIDGYDTGVRYADDEVGRLLDNLDRLGVLEETAVMISSDHGETLGELNVYGDHQTADQLTTRVPLLLSWPGLVAEARVDAPFHYQIDVAATLLELAGGSPPRSWDAQSFAADFKAGTSSGREYLVVSQGAWTAQRSVRWGDHLLIRTYHDAYHLYPDVMLFNVARDPHEQNDLARAEPALVAEGLAKLEAWRVEQMADHATGIDPLMNVVAEGGPFHVRGELPAYLERLRATERGHLADLLAEKHPAEVAR